MFEYKKCSAILVFNDKGELALQRRAVDDDKFPYHWDFSAGGGINEGEDEKDSVEREMLEEIGAKADAEFLLRDNFTYPTWDKTKTRITDLYIFRTKYNGPFVLDPKEVAEIKFFTFQEIETMINSKEKFHVEFLLAWEKGIIKKFWIK